MTEARLDSRLTGLTPESMHRLIVLVGRIDELRGTWSALRFPPRSVLEQMRRRVTEQSATASVRIADISRGAPVRQESRRTLPAGSPAPSLKAGGEAHRKAYVEVLDRVFREATSMKFSGELILQLHAELLKYSPGDWSHRGKLRTLADSPAPAQRGGAALGLHSTAPHMLAVELRGAVDWTVARLGSSDFHPLLVIASFILEFLAIRPFADANARTSRILTSSLLLHCGYPQVCFASLESVIAERWTEYYLALRRSQARRNLPRPDVTPWLFAFLDAFLVQSERARQAIVTPATEALSENQLAVLALLDQHRTVTNRLVCQELRLPRETAKQVLNRLLALNLVQRAGAGRAVRYVRPG